MAPASPCMLKWLATGLPHATTEHKVHWEDEEHFVLRADGDIIKEPNTVARVIAKAVTPELTGVLPVEQGQVVQWQSWASETEDILGRAVELNTFLEGRSFLVGAAPTLADIQIYWALAKVVALSFPGPLGGSVALMRWFDQIQNCLRVGAFAMSHDVTHLPQLVPMHSIFKPVAMPVYDRSKGQERVGAAASAHEGGGTASKESKGEAAAKVKGARQGDGETGEKAASSDGKGNYHAQSQGKKSKKKEEPAPATETLGKGETAPTENPNALDIRVGRLVKVWPHPEAEKLYCEEIDCGEESGPRQIASGLRQFYSAASELEGRMVLVLANLKPRKLVGFASNGMVLCASNTEHTQVKLVEPPAHAKVGYRVVFPGFSTESMPLTPAQVQKKKVFEALAAGLKTDSQGRCMFKDETHPFWVAGREGCEAGAACTAPLPNAHVS